VTLCLRSRFLWGPVEVAALACWTVLGSRQAWRSGDQKLVSQWLPSLSPRKDKDKLDQDAQEKVYLGPQVPRECPSRVVVKGLSSWALASGALRPGAMFYTSLNVPSSASCDGRLKGQWSEHLTSGLVGHQRQPGQAGQPTGTYGECLPQRGSKSPQSPPRGLLVSRSG
jgi:hypothetical protein